jgi:hypothetical protein
MVTKYTAAEIAKRIKATEKHRAAVRVAVDILRKKDRQILQDIHENRHMHHFYSWGDVTIDVVGVLGQTEEFRVFWTVRSPLDKDSFRIAKKTIGRYIWENRQERQFVLRAEKSADKSDLIDAALRLLQSMAFANKLQNISKGAYINIRNWDFCF